MVLPLAHSTGSRKVVVAFCRKVGALIMAIRLFLSVDSLRVPVIAAPMSPVSGWSSPIFRCRTGIGGTFSILNVVSSEAFVRWCERPKL